MENRRGKQTTKSDVWRRATNRCHIFIEQNEDRTINTKGEKLLKGGSHQERLVPIDKIRTVALIFTGLCKFSTLKIEEGVVISIAWR